MILSIDPRCLHDGQCEKTSGIKQPLWLRRAAGYETGYETLALLC